MKRKSTHGTVGKETLNHAKKAAGILTVAIITVGIYVATAIDRVYAEEPTFLNIQQNQTVAFISTEDLFWEGKSEVAGKSVVSDFLKKKGEGPSGRTYWYETPYSPMEIQEWEGVGYRPLYHYQEFYYINPDKNSPWERAVCVKLRSNYDLNESITNIAFLRSGKVYVFDLNDETECYEYRKDLKPRHKKLWLQGFEEVFGGLTRKGLKTI